MGWVGCERSEIEGRECKVSGWGVRVSGWCV